MIHDTVTLPLLGLIVYSGSLNFSNLTFLNLNYFSLMISVFEPSFVSQPVRTFLLSPLEGHDYQHLHRTFSSTHAEETFKAINICTFINSASFANMGFFIVVIITIIMMFKPVVFDFFME